MSDHPTDVPEPIVTTAEVGVAAVCRDDTVEPLLRDEGRPLFNDSWEAEAFALGKILVDIGVFTGREWFDVFSAEIKAAVERGDPDRGDTYYQHWMAALERICIEKGLTDPATLAESQRMWSLAVANTPHGVAIALENAWCPPQAPHQHLHDHDGHAHAPEPMAVFAGGMEEALEA